jgi:hypothetical protein
MMPSRLIAALDVAAANGGIAVHPTEQADGRYPS